MSLNRKIKYRNGFLSKILLKVYERESSMSHPYEHYKFIDIDDNASREVIASTYYIDEDNT
jgi:cytidylate kinase